MSELSRNTDFSFEGDSTATLEPIANPSDPALLDQLAKKLNAAPIKTEPVDFERMKQLETRLADREQLVSILTERLEQAADELDRIKRSGGVLSGSGANTGDTASLLEGHQEVAEKLGRFVDAWEERYEGPALRRLEAGIEELRERLEQATLHGHSSSGNSAVSRLFPHDEVGLRSGTLNQSTIESPDHSETDSLLETAPGRKPLDAPFRLVLISSDDVPDDFDIPLPQMIDENNAEPSELRKAVTDRDAYIRWLCHQIRSVTGRLEGWLGEVQAGSDDVTLHRRIDEIEKVIHDQLRIAEIDVSIERARLSRDQARLNEQSEQLARERDQFARATAPGNADEDTPMLRRWKKFIRNQDS
tara:strand:+ start:40350 stop:41429 length:1080 start_codon:yes stop_codon:yes gene_type:complete